MSDKTELLPCPFCGGKAHWPEPEVNIHYVGCMSCAACATGVEDWNRRAALAQHPAPVAVPDTMDEAHAGSSWEASYRAGWNACRAAMLSTAPAAPVAVGQEPVRELIGYACDRRGALIPDRCGDCLCWPAYEDATPAAEQPRMWLPKDERAVRELLASLNHDGGQHQHKVGIAQAARDALAEFDRIRQVIAEQPDTVKVPRELLQELADIADAMQCHDARDEAVALLGKGGEE